MPIALLSINASARNEFGAFRVRTRYFSMFAYKVIDFCCRGVGAFRYRLWPSSLRSLNELASLVSGERTRFARSGGSGGGTGEGNQPVLLDKLSIWKCVLRLRGGTQR